MRIHLKLTPNTEIVPFDYQSTLAGKLHQWLGHNDFHDAISLYSFSWLQNGKSQQGGLHFANGSQWFISAFQPEMIKLLIKGLQQNPYLAWGMSAKEVVIQEDPAFNGQTNFRVGSPVFIKQKKEEGIKFLFYDDPQSGECMTTTLKHKLDTAGLSSDGVTVAFDTTFSNPKTKKITYKGIENKASFCPVIVRGNPKQISFAWNVGVGNSTGIGFGSLI